MSEASDGPAVVVVVEGEEGTGGDGHSGEVETALEVAAVEEVADSAVEIARIEADRDVTIEAIRAETTEAMLEASAASELEHWRTRAQTAEAALTERETAEPLTSAVLVELPPSPPPPPSESMEEDGLRESPVEVVAVEEAAPAPEPEKPKRKPHRWI